MEDNVQLYNLFYNMIDQVDEKLMNGTPLTGELDDLFNASDLVMDSLNQNNVFVPIDGTAIKTVISNAKVLHDQGNDMAAYQTLNMFRDFFPVIQTMTHAYSEQVMEKKMYDLKRLEYRYKDTTDPEIKEILEFVHQRKKIMVFNYPFLAKYVDLNYEIKIDEGCGLKFTTYNGKRMYYKNNMTTNENEYTRFITVEQDEDSPHRYFDETVYVKEGDVVIDAGVAEGNFALEVIDRVKKIYLVECEEEWIEALRHTFEPYMDKVVIVDKFLGEKNDDTHISIDELCKGEKINYIKMDIEGAEQEALRGGENTIKNSDDFRCSICSYHQPEAEKEIKELLERFGVDAYASKGYMYFEGDEMTEILGDLRRGVVRGVKR